MDDERMFTLDAEPIDLEELIDANREGLDEGEIEPCARCGQASRSRWAAERGPSGWSRAPPRRRHCAARCPECQRPLALSDTKPEAGYQRTVRYSSGRPRPGVVYGLCAPCALMIEDVALMLEADDADRAEVPDAIDRARRARAIFDRGYGDKHAAMSTLAGAFRALRRGVPGVEPWDPDALWGWLEKGAATRHELACAHFLVTVWNSSGPAGPFDAMEARVGWERAHRAAFVEWARDLGRRRDSGAT